MAFRLERTESLEVGLKRILAEQMSAAADELERGQDKERAIHQARKRCKKIRAVYRLIRNSAPKVYRSENRRFRDLARAVSAARDADAMLEAYDKLLERFKDEVEDRRVFAQIRRRFTLEKNAAGENQSTDARPDDTLREGFRMGQSELANWQLPPKAAKAILKSLAETYRRCRKAMRQTLEKPSDRSYHEWRKRTKHLRHQTRVLRGLWPRLGSSVEKELRKLGDILGDDHDLAVMRELILDDLDDYAKVADAAGFLSLIDRRRSELQCTAQKLGERLFEAKPKAVRRGLSTYWSFWQGDRLPEVEDQKTQN